MSTIFGVGDDVADRIRPRQYVEAFLMVTPVHRCHKNCGIGLGHRCAGYTA